MGVATIRSYAPSALLAPLHTQREHTQGRDTTRRYHMAGDAQHGGKTPRDEKCSAALSYLAFPVAATALLRRQALNALPLDNLSTSRKIWDASSRVGARSRARTPCCTRREESGMKLHETFSLT